MSKLIRTYKMTTGHHYHVIDVDGQRITIKDAKDEADAISKAEYILSIVPPEPEQITPAEAIEVLLKADLTKTGKVDLAALSTKISTATKVEIK